MDLRITPAKLAGSVEVPPSKSVAHRMIIAAALAKGTSVIDRLYPSVDILTTLDAVKALGAQVEYSEGKAVITGIEEAPKEAVIDCRESGSTLRFMIPVAAALGVKTTFLGRANLPKRPITPYLEELPRHGIEFDYNNTMPFTISGRLTGGEFRVDGGISSQFITGLLLALPLTGEESWVRLTSHLQSKPYVDITIGAMKDFGCQARQEEWGYSLKAGQSYVPFNGAVEGDHSQGAFFKVANSLGSQVDIQGLNVNSFQGDKKIIEICEEIVYNKSGMVLDCSDIPDLVPVLSVLFSFCEGKSSITNVARLRIKESDRLAAMEEDLNRLGGKVKAFEDRLEIEGVDMLEGGAQVDCFVDHRIAMSMAIAATRCKKPIVLRGAECVSKSYPDFWQVYRSLGGIAEEI